MKPWKAILLPIGILVFTTFSIATVRAGQNAFRSATGDTVFPSAAFGCAGDKVPYTTRFQQKNYTGKLWVKSPIGLNCEGGRGRVVKGYFEERSQDGAEWCQGQLTLYLLPLPSGSYAQWSNIQPVPGYRCSGTGNTPRLALSYAAQ